MHEGPSHRGGLGIGRVVAEADMKLSIRIEDGVVVVCAELEG